MKLILASILLVLVSGCATSTLIKSPEGKDMHAITCYHYPENCYKKATKLCSSGYDVLDKTVASTGGAMVGHVVTNGSRISLMVTCKD